MAFARVGRTEADDDAPTTHGVPLTAHQSSSQDEPWTDNMERDEACGLVGTDALSA